MGPAHPDAALAGQSAVGADVGSMIPPELFGSAAREPSTSTAGAPRASTMAAGLEADRFLGILAKKTLILEQPKPRARALGYARTGALLRRSEAASSRDGCAGGWYRVEPFGYVCQGASATLDLEHVLLRAASREADRSSPLPYTYGQSRFPTPPLYGRLPTRAEQAAVEPDLAAHRANTKDAGWALEAAGSAPEFLLDGKNVPSRSGGASLGEPLVRGRAIAKSAFAFLDMFEFDGRPFGLTTDLSLLPLDRLKRVEPSEFSGVALDAERTLPLAFVRGRADSLYAPGPGGQGLIPARQVKYREAIFLTGTKRRANGVTWLETRDGDWLRESSAVEIVEASRLPKWAQGEGLWLSISITRQTLVAYRGARPVYATLVSTGADGLGDPAETHSTPLGVFRVFSKHVTATMAGDEVGDEFDLRDIPYVQYFHEGYALHAAFWHDGFGMPKSHGCINLSPRDARILFQLTSPPVPSGWHGAESRAGTIVYVHR